MKSRFAASVMAAAVGLTAANQPLYAQPAGAASAGAEMEEVEVTGTRIRRDTFSSAMPIVSIDKEDLLSIGSNSLTDALLEIPSVVSGLSQTNTTANLQNAGLSSVELRNLGDNRTLVLIDGRRTVSNSANGNRVSLGTIPASFVERVEYITGGASSIYGSDAVAGVVNIITENNQEGFEFDARYGEGNGNGYHDYTLDVSFGSAFAGDRGYFFTTLNYDEQSGIEAKDVVRALVQASWDYENGVNVFETAAGDQPAAQITRDQLADLSADPDGGRFDGNNFWYDDNGLREDFVTNRDGFDFRRDDHIFIPRERLNAAFKVRYEITAGLEAFAQATYSKVDTDNLREPEGDDFNDPHTLFDFANGTSELIAAGRIPLNNPFVPQQIADAVGGDISWDRRFVEVGLQRTVNERETTRFWAGLRGDVFSDWDWEASFGYGKYEQDQTRFNEINILNLTEGLNAEVGPGGEIRCASAEARANGCVPVNLFGRGSITPAAADYIRANLGLQSEVEQVNLQAYMTGNLWELPHGLVGVAFGAEYRKDELSLEPGELNRTGGHSSNFVPMFSGELEVTELFFEVSVPLLADLPGVQSLVWDVSARYADYDLANVGGVTSYGTGLQWRPIDDLNFRATYNRALRAPDIAEAFSPPRGDTDNFDDICIGVTLSTPGVVAENCRAEPGVLANIQANGSFDDETRGKFSPNAGNPDVSEETADTVTAGIVWQPGFLPDFNLAVDYYIIEIEDAIDSLTNEEILRQCYEDGQTFGEQNPFCRDITRDSEGQIVGLIQRQLNLDSLEVEGVDATVRYSFGLEALGLPGELDLSYRHSHVIKHEIVAQGVQSVVDDKKGELDDSSEVFEDRSQFKLDWTHNNLKVTWRAKYFGSVNDDNDLKEEYREALAANPDAEKPLYLDIDSEVIHDLNIGYRLQTERAGYRFYGGVRNVFDNDGPFLPAGTSGGGDNHNDVYGNIRGRYAYVGATLTF
ncbi:TonB-dependent receptor [Exilibacterium tricleocarpae]|uniref:TonB-dependent receptor n=1 Tax=Exilibacterium tricleocarpae TaxID=2591008 RepID=A0A545TNE6_9GAMM|nr:TonB-dependent receptor [Exilibacterium tricleocarpae]TQV78745.1 TonB-dependent receptor [Exilibacterium tricleocarpae]